MGLGAPKRRNKLSQDPNNTVWSKSTDTYGHKILSAQGWKPGDYLGAKNASHSDHYTAANASHIRTLLREDNLGLGAKIGKNNAETFGLSLFSGVLGRLNGKSDAEVEKHQFALRDAELRTYHAQKYGLLNFVSGGLLVGDKIQPLAKNATDAGTKRKRRLDLEQEERKSKKKRQSENGDEIRVVRQESKIEKRRSKDKNSAEPSDKFQSSQMREANHDEKEGDLTKRKKRKLKKSKRIDETESEQEVKMNAETSEDERLRSKQEKRARKEHRRKRKEQKRSSTKKDSMEQYGSSARSEDESSETPPSKTPQSDLASGNRHAIRHRYIQQKRMSTLDAATMKEIFMLTASA